MMDACRHKVVGATVGQSEAGINVMKDRQKGVSVCTLRLRERSSCEAASMASSMHFAYLFDNHAASELVVVVDCNWTMEKEE